MSVLFRGRFLFSLFVPSMGQSRTPYFYVHVTFEVTDGTAPASTGATSRVMTVPATPGDGATDFAPGTEVVFYRAVHQMTQPVHVTITALSN